MNRVICCLILLTTTASAAQNIPPELRGKWTIQREVPTPTISCWGEEEAKSIIRTEIEYTADSFRWSDIVVKRPAVKVVVITAEQFHDENSSPSANGSQVSFRQLGIRTSKAKQVTISHPPASLTGATTEIPGDVVLLKNRSTIAFPVCNVYFEAKRVWAAPKMGVAGR